MFEELEESLISDCECSYCRLENVGVRKAFQALRDGMELVMDITVDRDSFLTLADRDGMCEVRLEFKSGEHITVYIDEKRGGWVIGARGDWKIRSNKSALHLILEEEGPRLRDIAIKLGAAVGMHPDAVYDQFVALILSQRTEE